MKITLFSLVSVDGKISTGEIDGRDFDHDLPVLVEGLDQYYEAERTTSLWSLNSGRTLAKCGINNSASSPAKTPVTFVAIDSTHLTSCGVNNLLAKANKLVVVTTNAEHPAFTVADNLTIIQYDGKIDWKDLCNRLEAAGCDELTVQTGSTLNAILLRAGLLTHVRMIVAPVLVGGVATPSLIGGPSIIDDLSQVRRLRLVTANVLKHGFLELIYEGT